MKTLIFSMLMLSCVTSTRAHDSELIYQYKSIQGRSAQIVYTYDEEDRLKTVKMTTRGGFKGDKTVILDESMTEFYKRYLESEMRRLRIASGRFDNMAVSLLATIPFYVGCMIYAGGSVVGIPIAKGCFIIESIVTATSYVFNYFAETKEVKLQKLEQIYVEECVQNRDMSRSCAVAESLSLVQFAILQRTVSKLQKINAAYEAFQRENSDDLDDFNFEDFL